MLYLYAHNIDLKIFPNCKLGFSIALQCQEMHHQIKRNCFPQESRKERRLTENRDGKIFLCYINEKWLIKEKSKNALVKLISNALWHFFLDPFMKPVNMKTTHTYSMMIKCFMYIQPKHRAISIISECSQ